MRSILQYRGILGMRSCIFLVLMIPPLFFSCGEWGWRFPVPAVEADPTQHRDQADEGLSIIAENARNTLPIFFRRLQSPLRGDGNFRIKYAFKTGEGSAFSREQVWLSDIRYKDRSYSGVLVSAPYYISGLARGDRVDFNIEEVTDWMFTREGKITGGLSIKYLLEQIPEYERDEEQRRILEMFYTP
jgi:uncharacterized protein YegJ (DUF2314 family)